MKKDIMICEKCGKDKLEKWFKKKYKDDELKLCNVCRMKCEHNRQRSKCKDCNGCGICEHNKQRFQCKDCNGGGICEHNKQRSRCKDCNGGSICEHNKRRSDCKDCNGGGICEHNKRRSRCKNCSGGSICEHKKIRSRCKDCNGGSICEHNKRRSDCKVCEPEKWLIYIQRSRISQILKSKTKKTQEYLGCTGEFLYNYIQSKMTDGMTFDNIHIDHIKPCSKFDLTKEEEREKCFHYTNLQPLFVKDNLEKSNKWSNEDEINWRENIIFNSCQTDNSLKTVIAE